jgi:ATP-binding cassette, subfamily F, member 3
LSLRFDPQDRIALLGKNGNGKSTLTKLLAGKLDLMGGEMVRARKLAVGYFAQHQQEELDLSLTPVETLSAKRPKLIVEEVRTQLGGFGFSADKALTRVGELSGGERARLMLALATLDKPNLLILDEPTNHLDIDARNELLSALNDFDGAVVLVSHDRRLIEATAERLLLVSDGKVMPFLLLSGDDAPARPGLSEPKPTKERLRRDAAQRRKELRPLKDRVESAESQIFILQAELAKLDRALADPLLFAQDPAKGSAVSKKRADAARKLAAAESQWLAAQQDYETALAAE